MLEVNCIFYKVNITMKDPCCTRNNIALEIFTLQQSDCLQARNHRCRKLGFPET